MKQEKKQILNELTDGGRISQYNIFFKYFIFPWTLDSIIWELRRDGYIISTIPYADKEYKLMKDKNGKIYE